MLVARCASGKVGFAEVMAPKVRWRCFIPSLEGDSRAPTSLLHSFFPFWDFCVIPTVCHGHPVQSFSVPPLSSKLGRGISEKSCGERGIRTPETLLEFTRFPGVPLQPLEHLSFALATSNLATLSGTIHLTTRKGTKNI